MAPGGPVSRSGVMSYRDRHPHRRRLRGYDGVTDQEIFVRDGWCCRMPKCLCPAGRAIEPGRRSPDQWAASIDHIIPAASGGLDSAANKRAAHRFCNSVGALPAQAVARVSIPPLTAEPVVLVAAEAELTYNIGDRFPALAALLDPGQA